MPDLAITVASVEVVPYAAALALRLKVANKDAAEAIHIQIEVAKRRYTPEEQAGLRDLFGEPERWGQTLKPLLWTNTSAVVPRFTGEATVDLQVPCTFDFSVATTKYFNGLEDGEIPVLLMFSGTVFYADEEGSLRVAPIVGQGNEISRAVESLEGHDGRVLSEHRVAVPASRRVRRAASLQSRARDSQLGTGVREAARGSGGAAMNIEKVEKIADAVLYEGYMLYPYRASAVKNRQRFNFGVLYPRDYGEAWETQTECLVHGPARIEAKPVHGSRVLERHAVRVGAQPDHRHPQFYGRGRLRSRGSGASVAARRDTGGFAGGD